MKKHQKSVGKTDTWLTPPEILAPLGQFDLDPCAAPRPSVFCATWNLAMPFEDGLKSVWSVGDRVRGDRPMRVWCNPPFNRYERPKWMAKMADHGNGIMLIPAATETRAFHEHVWKRAHAICFILGRPHFLSVTRERAPFNCGTAICLVAYGESNAQILKTCGLGTTIHLTPSAPGKAVASTRPRNNSHD